MPVQSSPGTDNLRADPSVKSAAPNASPAGGGKDVGGKDNLRADLKVMSNPGKSTPTLRAGGVPGVQKFNDGSV